MTIEQLCDFNNMRNKIREMLIDNYQGLHLIRQGLWHWLNVLGQSFFFSKEENSIIRDSAGKEADLLIVPVNQGMSTDELAATTAIHAFPFWFFIVLDNQSDAAKHFKATRRNYPSFYDSWVYIHWQIRIAQRHQSLLIERICANPVAQNTIRILVEETEQAAYESLKNLIMKKVKFGIPVDEKESLVNYFLGEWIVKLWDMPVSKVYHEAFFTDTVVWRDIAKEIKKVSVRQWGQTVNIDDIQEPEAPESKPRYSWDRELDDTQRKLLNKAYGKSAAKVIEVYLNDPDATIPKIAKQTGISERTVKSIRAQMKKKGKEKFWDLI